jgi:hypothetical protein
MLYAMTLHPPVDLLEQKFPHQIDFEDGYIFVYWKKKLASSKDFTSFCVRLVCAFIGQIVDTISLLMTCLHLVPPMQ